MDMIKINTAEYLLLLMSEQNMLELHDAVKKCDDTYIDVSFINRMPISTMTKGETTLTKEEYASLNTTFGMLMMLQNYCKAYGTYIRLEEMKQMLDIEEEVTKND